MAVDTSGQKEWVKDLTDWKIVTGIDGTEGFLVPMGITSGAFSWTGNSEQAATIRYSLDSDKVFFVDPSSVSDITMTQPDMEDILGLISQVANVTFIHDDQNPNIVFSASNTSHTHLEVIGQTANKADIYLSSLSTSTILHEVSHALGVSHPEQSENFLGGGDDSDFDESLTVMSYQPAKFGSDLLGSPEMLMPFDIATLQFLYGANTTTNSGDTVYVIDHNGVSVEEAGSINYINQDLLSFWDAGGIDTYKIADGITEGSDISLVSGEKLTEDNLFFSAGDLSYVGLNAVEGSLNSFSNFLTNAFSFGGDVGTGIIENAIGGGGDDFIIGNQLDNNFEGRGGNDYFYGSTGTDTVIYSGNYSDYNIVEGLNEVTITDLNLSDGDDGEDTLEKIEHIKFANKIFDIGVTTNNADSLIGSDDDYILVGDSGNDTLDAGIGENEVYGGQNDDIITIANGASGTYDGGLGNDTFIVKSVGNIDTSVLTLIGGSGYDTITFEGGQYGSYIADQRDPDNVTLSTFDGSFYTELSGFEEAHLATGTVLTNINSDYDLTLGAIYDYSFLDASNGGLTVDIDIFTSSYLNGSTLNYIRTIDTSIGVNGNTHAGQLFNGAITGTDAAQIRADLNYTSAGAYLGSNNGDIITIDGINQASAWSGQLDYLLGLGNDVVTISNVTGGDFSFSYTGGNDTINNPDGVTVVVIDGDIQIGQTSVVVTTTGGLMTGLVLTTPEGTLTLTDLSGIAPELAFVSGGSYNFNSDGTYSQTGTTLDGYQVSGSWGDDVIVDTDGVGRHYITFDGTDSVSAGAGDDILNGGYGYDRLNGGAGNNVLFGGGGDDTLYVGQGNDTITGGVGSDRIVVGASSGGSVTITDFDLSNDIVDLSNVSDIASYAELNLIQSGSDTVIYAEGGIFSVTLQNVGFTSFSESNFAFSSVGGGGGAFTNTLPLVPSTVQTGTSIGETLTAVAFDGEVLYGLGGSDTLHGGDGNDYLYGGDDGDFELWGAGGNDVLVGGGGFDQLAGGIGDDFYLMNIDVDLGFDAIWDNGGTDALVLNGNISTSDIAFSVSGDTLQVSSTGFTLWQGVDIYDFFSAPYVTGEEYKVEYIVIQDVVYDLEDVYNTGVWTPAVTGSSGAPFAFDDLITIEGGGSYTGSVLANNGNGVDYDTDGSFLEVIPFSQTGAYGTLDVAADGSISIVAPYNYVGTHTFSYTLLNFDGNANQATVQLDFVAENIAPVAGFIDSEEYVEDGTALSFTPTFTDADGDALTYSMSMQDGSVVPDFSIDPNTGLISGTASMGYATYPIRITAFDGEAEVTHDMNIIVYVESQGTVNVDYIHGGTGVDYIYGDDGDDHLYGYGGYDELYGEAGNDYLYGYEGDDDLNGNDGDDHLYGNEGHDALYGGAGSDTIYGHEGDDQIAGGTEDDYLYGLEGDDWLFGEDGNDRLRGDDDANSDTFVGAGNDVLFGYAGNDNIAGGAGNDILYGGVGNDVLYGNAGDDFLLAEEGDDFLYGGAGTDSLNGGDGIDKLYGEAGTDTLNGGAGTDTLYAGDDNDILIGGTGTDFLYGQGGADTFKLDLTSIDRLSDFDASEGDTIDIADLLIGYNSQFDDINDFVTLVYRNAGRTDIRVNDDGLGNDLPYVGIVFSDLTGETVNTLVANGTLVVE